MKYCIYLYIFGSYILNFVLLKYCEWWWSIPDANSETPEHIAKALMFLLSPAIFPFMCLGHSFMWFAEVFR